MEDSLGACDDSLRVRDGGSAGAEVSCFVTGAGLSGGVGASSFFSLVGCFAVGVGGGLGWDLGSGLLFGSGDRAAGSSALVDFCFGDDGLLGGDFLGRRTLGCPGLEIFGADFFAAGVFAGLGGTTGGSCWRDLGFTDSGVTGGAGFLVTGLALPGSLSVGGGWICFLAVGSTGFGSDWRCGMGSLLGAFFGGGVFGDDVLGGEAGGFFLAGLRGSSAAGCLGFASTGGFFFRDFFEGDFFRGALPVGSGGGGG